MNKMYKIFLLYKSDGKRDYFSPYTITIENKDEDGNTISTYEEEWVTDSIEELKETVNILLQVYPQPSIRIIEDVTYMLDIVIEGDEEE